MAKEKNAQAFSSNSNSKRSRRKMAKTDQKAEKLIDISFEENSSISNAENTIKNVSVRQVTNNSLLSKCFRIVNNKDMNKNYATSPSSPSVAFFTLANSSIA